jgi:hypothetical protein
VGILYKTSHLLLLDIDMDIKQTTTFSVEDDG